MHPPSLQLWGFSDLYLLMEVYMFWLLAQECISMIVIYSVAAENNLIFFLQFANISIFDS
jgi:hypothetical protein